MDGLAQFFLQKQVCVGFDVYVFKLSCNSDNSALAAATSEHVIRLFNPESLLAVRALEGHGDNVSDVGFCQGSPHGLLSCSTDGSARLWDLRAAEAAVRTFNVSSDEVFSCAVGCNDTVAACAAGAKVHTFDVGTGKSMHVYRDCHTDVVNHVRFHPVDTTKMISGAEDNLVVIVDTCKPNDDAMLMVLPNEECVQSFSLVGPTRETLCCASTTNDVRVWGLAANECGMKKAEFLGLRQHPLLMREESFGYFIEMFYDMPSSTVFLLAGAGNEGEAMLFRVADSGPMPVATFAVNSSAAAAAPNVGHREIVRSAVCLPGGTIVTAGEDGCVCAWREETSKECFQLEATSYEAERTSVAKARAAPY
mmetsp:Transcript_31309/g.73002  ORF Transcript_31309/g.73002 Transcript_31309/m.73002 type:complete len:365 (+) Transcript_31309:153-1247(+)